MLESVTHVISNLVESFLACETSEWLCGFENVARASSHMGSKWMFSMNYPCDLQSDSLCYVSPSLLYLRAERPVILKAFSAIEAKDMASGSRL